MEVIIAIVIIWWLVSSMVKAAEGGKKHDDDSQQDNLDLWRRHRAQQQRERLDSMQIRLFNKTIPGSEITRAEIIEMQGRFPITERTKLGVVTSLYDITESTKRAPLFSFIDDMQEELTHAYQHKVEFGNMSVGYGVQDWANVALIIPDMLQPPYSGTRRLEAEVRLIDLDNPPIIVLGAVLEDGSILWSGTLRFEHTFSIKGYIESAENRQKAQALSIQIAMAVAMSDGELHESEGKVIRDWVVKAISSFEGEKKEKLKKIYNDAMKTAYANPQPIFELTKQLNDIDEEKAKYDAIELSYDVMAADGKMAPEEADILKKISESLDIDPDELEKIKGTKVISVLGASQLEDCDQVLGIGARWSKARIKKHLQSEFRKWNNRLSALPEGEQRHGAQKMLDCIAESRKKHGL